MLIFLLAIGNKFFISEFEVILNNILMNLKIFPKIRTMK
jgi:hypothetical protein